MDLRRIAGVLLVMFGIVAIVWGGISWTENKTVLDIGPLQATTHERKTIPLPPVVGVIGLIGGIALLAISSRRRT